MILKIKKGIIYLCEEGLEDNPIGSIFDNVTDETEQIIECGAELLPAVQDFVKAVNSGSFKPRTIVKTLEAILDKYDIKEPIG